MYGPAPGLTVSTGIRWDITFCYFSGHIPRELRWFSQTWLPSCKPSLTLLNLVILWALLLLHPSPQTPTSSPTLTSSQQINSSPFPLPFVKRQNQQLLPFESTIPKSKECTVSKATTFYKPGECKDMGFVLINFSRTLLLIAPFLLDPPFSGISDSFFY